MAKRISLPRIGNRNIDNALGLLTKEINELNDKVINPLGKDYEGSEGSLRFVEGLDGKGYLEGRGGQDWYTTFEGVFRKKITDQRPYPYFEKLMVEELYATKFIVNQLESTKEVLISQGGAEVEKVTANTITWKDPNKLKTCPFGVNDLILCRQISLDKGLEVRKVKCTVTAVSTNVTTVTLDYGVPRAGDVFVHVGNTTNTARQSSILMSVNDDNAPFIDMYDDINSWTDWEYAAGVKTQARLGNLAGITDVKFGALSGYGLYAQNVYLKGAISISNPSDIKASEINNDAGWTANSISISSSSPSNPTTYQMWYDTSAGDVVLKYWDGDSWELIGTEGTYIDGDGIYTGALACNQLTAGSGIIANLAVLSTLTMGSAATDGYIQSYGWDGSANGFQIKGGATPSIGIIGGTITGGTIQTATSGQRITINESGYVNTIRIYNPDGTLSGAIYGTIAGLPILNFTAYDVRFAAAYLSNTGNISSNQYITANSGFINGTLTAGRYLRSNGTSFVSNTIQAGDLPTHSHSASNITSGVLALAVGGTNASSWTANRVVLVNAIADGLTYSTITATKLGYLNDVTSAIQNQLDNRLKLIDTATQTLGGTSYAYGFLFQRSDGTNAPATFDQRGAGLLMDIRQGGTTKVSISNTGILKAIGYQSSDGSAGIDKSETGVTNFDIEIKDGLITSFTKH